LTVAPGEGIDAFEVFMEEKQSTRRQVVQYLVLIPVLIALGCGLYYGARGGFRPGLRSLPDVVGKPCPEAMTILTRAGFAPEADSMSGPRAVVVRQDPPAGRAPKGSRVTLTALMPSAKIPSVEGLTILGAESIVLSSGFRVANRDTVYDAKVPAGYVIGTSPWEEAPESSPLTLLVSRGPELAQLPNLVGMNYNEAIRAVGEAGFAIGEMTPKKSKKVKQVLSQKPAPGTYPKGSMVFLTVGVQSEMQKPSTDSDGGIVFPEAQTPPYPTRYFYPGYPEYLKKTGLQGDVVFDLEISPTGRISNVKLVKSLMPGRKGFDEIAFNAVYRWQFSPGIRGGKKGTGTIRVAIPFYLDEKQNKAHRMN
jgi:TonB family protein